MLRVPTVDVVDVHLVGALELAQEEVLVAEGHGDLFELLREVAQFVGDRGQDGGFVGVAGVGYGVAAHQRAVDVPDEHPIEPVRLVWYCLLSSPAAFSGHSDCGLLRLRLLLLLCWLLLLLLLFCRRSLLAIGHGLHLDLLSRNR